MRRQPRACPPTSAARARQRTAARRQCRKHEQEHEYVQPGADRRRAEQRRPAEDRAGSRRGSCAVPRHGAGTRSPCAPAADRRSASEAGGRHRQQRRASPVDDAGRGHAQRCRLVARPGGQRRDRKVGVADAVGGHLDEPERGVDRARAAPRTRCSARCRPGRSACATSAQAHAPGPPGSSSPGTHTGAPAGASRRRSRPRRCRCPV